MFGGRTAGEVTSDLGNGGQERAFVSGLIGAGHAATRHKLRNVCAGADIYVAYEAVTAEAAVSGAAETKPDVCLLSTCLVGHGFITIAKITARRPSTAVLLIDDDPQPDRMLHALSAGASGYLPATTGSDGLVRAVQAMRAGHLAVPQNLLRHLVDELLRPGRRTATARIAGGNAALTKRERELVDLLGRGLSSEQIAVQLFLSPATVRSHIFRIAKKLGMGGRHEVVAFAKALRKPR